MKIVLFLPIFEEVRSRKYAVESAPGSRYIKHFNLYDFFAQRDALSWLYLGENNQNDFIYSDTTHLMASIRQGITRFQVLVVYVTRPRFVCSFSNL